MGLYTEMMDVNFTKYEITSLGQKTGRKNQKIKLYDIILNKVDHVQRQTFVQKNVLEDKFSTYDSFMATLMAKQGENLKKVISSQIRGAVI